ncbi:hypothetical protein CBOM_00624 [Ceraceosorus bombacis]|uniref:Uncharacterized protein n=1 Tax=Ceraceosorus bombacis TaxID=401625 RepID=A0A0N7L931_9BASI|nr:hypothetical protein CBOM_00624 [Ceraceosorus bombacis]
MAARSPPAALVPGVSYLAARAPPWTQLGNVAITHNDAIHGVIETVPEPHRKAVIEHLHNYVGNTINEWHGGIYGYKINKIEDWGEGLDIGRGFKATGESYSAHKSLLSPSHVIQVSHPAPPPHWPFGPATL